MCRPASMLVTKKRVLWSKTTDSHTEIRKEFSIAKEQPGRIIRAVAVEIRPPNRNDGIPDYAAEPDRWRFCVDQDLLPDWWDVEEAENRVRDRLVDWIADHVVKVDRGIKAGEVVFVCSGVTVDFNSGTVTKNYWTVDEIKGGQVVTYTKLPSDILKGHGAVLIDRSGDKVVCHVYGDTN